MSVGLTVLLCQMVEVPDHGRLAAITVALVMVISSGNPELSPFANAALRFIESVIVAGTAVLAVLLWPKAKEVTSRTLTYRLVRRPPQEFAPARKEPIPIASART